MSKKRDLEIGVCCKNLKEHRHMINIIVYLQHVLRKTTLMQTDIYPEDRNKLEKWSRVTIQNYTNLIPAEKSKSKHPYPIINSKRPRVIPRTIRR